jgi:Glyoxalase/Bleomycin resistance protein/Dioxygenase superfamily
MTPRFRPPGRMAHERRPRSQEDGDAIAALLAKGVLPMIQLRCDDLDATFDKIAGAPGVEVLQEPTSQFWGVRDFAVHGPAGNMVRVEQGAAAATCAQRAIPGSDPNPRIARRADPCPGK